MKKLIVCLIFISVLIVGCGMKVSEMDSSQLVEYTLNKRAVKNVIGDEEIVSHQVSTTVPLKQDGYDSLYEVMPSCLDKLEIGDTIRPVLINTGTREINVIWSVENNKIVCIIS